MSDMRLQPVRFRELVGWGDDDHSAAFSAFQTSAGAVIADLIARGGICNAAQDVALSEACREAIRRGPGRVSRSEARGFFERFFEPLRIVHDRPQGLLTGYYEPVVYGSRVRAGRFHVPLYRRPPDLENMVAETERGRAGVRYTHMRRTVEGLEPFPMRAEIDAGALSGRGLEIMWLADPVDAFFAQVQGSLRVRLPDGTTAGLTYDGKNGYPYTSIGRILIERGEIAAADMSMGRLGEWLRADAARGREMMQNNASFAFFREADGASALSALGCVLTAGRSLAVDTGHHALGLPVFVDAPGLMHWGQRRPFRRLMIAQDVGSAIRGAERGDIYFGSGGVAEQRAGITKHRGNLFVLMPRVERSKRRAAR
jgi:membrane-bound lytic murein transglycosylase A